MVMAAGYGQFCPVAMASEILCTRWTSLVLRELLCGSTRFNELRRGVPLMSPALLSKRLKQLEAARVIERGASGGGGGPQYRLTPAGEDLRPVILSLGFWGQRWIESDLSLKNLDPSLLMWDMRRSLDISPLPSGRRVIQFVYQDIDTPKRDWWLVIDKGEVDLCKIEPGFPVDLYVEAELRIMTMIWMGLTTVAEERRADRLQLDGDKGLAKSMQRWLGLSHFATEPKKTEGLVAQVAAE